MVKAAELVVEFTGDTRSLERASARTQDLMRQNEIAILKAQNALNKINKITFGDFGSSGARSAAGSYRALGQELASVSPMLGRFAGAGAAGAGIGALVTGVYQLGKVGVTYKETLEKLSKSFETLLGSQRAAAAHLKELQDFAARTPFEFEDVARASQRFQNMGLAAKDVIPTLTAVGNAVAAAGGGSEQIDRVSLALSQMAAKGKVSAEEMNQLAEAGVGGWKILEEQLGKSKGELMKMAEQGQISANTFLQAFRQAHGSGNAMQRQMETLSGATSTLKDYAKTLLAEGFAPLHGLLKDISVELAKNTTEGFNFARALQAVGSAAENAAKLASPFAGPFAAGALGAPFAQLSALAAAARAKEKGGGGWGEAPINIPEELRYKPKISDADLIANMKRLDAQALEESQRKARAETERQSAILQRIKDDYAEASVRVTRYAHDSLQLEAALYKLSIGYHTLSDANKALAQAEINRLFSAKRELEHLNAKDALQKSLNAVMDEYRSGVEADGKATERVTAALGAFVDTGTKADDVLLKLAARATRLAAEMDSAAAMSKLAAENQKSFEKILANSPIEPGKAFSDIKGPELKPLDLSNVVVDHWADFRQQLAELAGAMGDMRSYWRENMLVMAEDGSRILGRFFTDIKNGFGQAALSMLAAFTDMLAQMAAQALANQIFSALLGFVAPGLGGGKAAGFIPGFGDMAGFATGGSFIVGGGGGVDKTPVAFMATRGERVTVETPGQQGQSGVTHVHHWHINAVGVSSLLSRETQAQVERRMARSVERGFDR